MSKKSRRRRGGSSIAFSSLEPPRLPGVGIPGVQYPLINPKTEERVSGREGLESSITVGAGPTVDRQSTYAATNLSPLAIQSILQSADQAVVLRYADLDQQVRQRDSHLFGIDRQRRGSVANKPFLLLPKDDSPLAKGLRDFTQSFVHEIDGLPSAFYEILTANSLGYGALENIFAPGRVRSPWNGSRVVVEGLWPRQLRWVHGKHFQFTYQGDRPLLDLGNDGAIRLPKYKFIYHQVMGEGIAAGRGYMRPVIWPHFFKHCGWRDFAIFLHLYGIPQLWGEIDRGLFNNPVMRSVLELALIAYGSGSSAPILPTGMKINAAPGPLSSGAADAHAKMIGLCNAEESKAVLGEQLTIEVGESGSYKLGEVHADSKHEVVVGDAISLCSNLRTDLIRATIELNLQAIAKAFAVPPDEILAAIPLCAFQLDRETSPLQWMTMAEIAARIGVPLSIRQIREKNNFNRPADEADRLVGPPVTIPADGAVVGANVAGAGVSNPKPQQPPDSGALPR